MAGWLIHRVRLLGDMPVSAGRWGAEELAQREAAVRILPGSAFMTRPDGGVDPTLTLYFNSHSFYGKLRQATQVSYLKDYRLFFNFLWQRGKTWRDTTPNDIYDYEDWRRRAPANPRRIAGSKWTRELAALNRLYKWAHDTGIVDVNPITLVPARHGRAGLTPEVAAHDVVATNVKWLTPRAWERWRDVGLLGFDKSGLPQPSFRGRNADRNAAYADLLFDSGLRLTEGASLVLAELPDISPHRVHQRARVASAVAKYGSGRPFIITTATMRRILAYQLTSRAEAVHAAQRLGRYDVVRDKLIIIDDEQRSPYVLRWINEATGARAEGRLETISVDDRKRLYYESKKGYEPVWLWLGEHGLPFDAHSWEGVFSAASARCRHILGVGAPACTPHMARHSFALYMLIALHHATDTRYGITPEQRRDFEELYRNPWRMVKDLLGHRSELTTRKVYLAPVSDIQISSLLQGDYTASAPLLQAVAIASGLVRDYPNE